MEQERCWIWSLGSWPGQVGNLQLIVWFVCLTNCILAMCKTKTNLLSHQVVLSWLSGSASHKLPTPHPLNLFYKCGFFCLGFLSLKSKQYISLVIIPRFCESLWHPYKAGNGTPWKQVLLKAERVLGVASSPSHHCKAIKTLELVVTSWCFLTAQYLFAVSVPPKSVGNTQLIWLGTLKWTRLC